MHANSTTAQTSLASTSIRVALALPGGGESSYRGTRFDWSGVVSSLEFQGHTWFGRWFERMDPSIHDFTYDSSGIIAGPCTAVTGPVEEFTAALGYQDAAVGGTFVKIGVGVLRKPSDAKYDSFHLYGATWSSFSSRSTIRRRDSAMNTPKRFDSPNASPCSSWNIG